MTDSVREGESPPKPKRQKMVQVYNKHFRRSIVLKDGKRIGPRETARIPVPVFEKMKDQCSFLVRAERGDVI